MRLLAPLLLFVSAFLFVSCETTQSGYGFIVEGLDDASIEELIIVSDESINERDYEIHKDLYSPKYYHIDKSDKFRMDRKPMSRFEYLESVRDIFKRAKELLVYTEITDIEYTEPGRSALVTVREEYRLHFNGRKERMVSIVELEIGFEDGWIFIEKATTTAKQEIKE